MGLGKKAKNKAKAVKGQDQERCRQGQAQRQESQECREALTRLPGSIHQRQPLDAAAEEPEADRRELAGRC